jgi:hypothetical protein
MTRASCVLSMLVLLQGRDHHPQAAHPDLQGDHSAAGSGPALTRAAGQVRVRGGEGAPGEGGLHSNIVCNKQHFVRTAVRQGISRSRAIWWWQCLDGTALSPNCLCEVNVPM